MKHSLLALIAVTVLSAPAAFAQAKLVEKVEKNGNAISISYEKYIMPNGLTVIVHEDHSDPVVHVDVTYHVGSAREEISKSGFAHFFEHMMFQGSDNVADEQHFKIITEAGGTLNGTTNRDRTNYFETVPSNQLEKMLWLEADRMGFLLDAVTQKKFEVQRATVKNERGQRYDNVPYGLVGEVTAKNLYPYGHPYSWLTIGYVEDLDRVNADDLKNFFLRWYGPNNAVITVGGDVSTKNVIKLVEKYFGSIPRGPEVAPVKLKMPELKSNRYVSMVDSYAKLPQLRIVFPTPPSYDKDEAALDCLAEILGQGKNSILYKNFVKTQKAVNASSYNSTSELAGEFVINVMPYPGQKLREVEKMMRASLDEFERNGPSDEDIEKFANAQEASLINRLESVSGKVSQLASFYTFTGDANYIGKELKRYTSVTKEDVIRVYNTYIKGQNAVILSVLPKGQDDNKAANDNYTVSSTGYTAPDYGYTGLKYNKAKDNFDRSKMPGNGANPIVKVPEFWRKELPGNIKIIGTKSDEIPVVTVLIRIKGGKLIDSYDSQKAGLTNMFAAMMEEDSKNFTAEAFSVELDKLGSSIDISPNDDNIQVSIRTLTKNLDKTMKLVEERLLRPNFTEEAFSTNKKRITESIKNAKVRGNFVAGTVYNKVIFGADNVLGWPAYGTEETIKNIQLSDIQNYYNNYFSRKDIDVIVVGDVEQKDIISKIEFLKQLPEKDVKLPSLTAAAKPGKTKIYFVDIPNSAQTEFRIGYVTNLKYDGLGDFYKATVMNYPLGGAFNSRLNLDLREDKGWTYGARGNFDGDKYTGTYTFSAGIKANATDSAMRVVQNIMKEYKSKGVTADELKFTQSSITQSDARKYEVGYQKAGFLSRIMEYNLPSDYAVKQNEILKKMTVNDVNSLAGKYLPDADNMYIVLVGDKAKVWDGVTKLGYEIVELDKDGNPLK